MARIIPEPSSQRIFNLKIANEFVYLQRLLAISKVTRVLAVNDGRHISKYSSVHHSWGQKKSNYCKLPEDYMYP